MAPTKSSTAKRTASAAQEKGEQLPATSAILAALTMADAAARLRCSTPTTYLLVSAGHLKTFLVGRRRYTSPQLVQECVETLVKLGSVTLQDHSGALGQEDA